MNRSPLAVRMTWHDLLFAHWPLSPHVIRPLIPPVLQLDTFDGMAWLGVVPFRMSGVGPRVLPPLPGVSAFAELNVRTYVRHQERPGVWFFSLDAADPLAVRVARRFFHLPYFDAQMSCRSRAGWIEYRSTRTHRGAPPATLDVRYRPAGDVYRSRPGDLDHWLTERYCLYAVDRAAGLRRVDIEHEPWPLQPAEATWRENRMAEPLGLPLAPTPTCLHFARRLSVVAGPLLREA